MKAIIAWEHFENNVKKRRKSNVQHVLGSDVAYADKSKRYLPFYILPVISSVNKLQAFTIFETLTVS
jgi:hypothetical protein